MSSEAEETCAPVPVISIWGSCVSRDTLSQMSRVKLGAYVARQSAITSLSPIGDREIPLEMLDSQFQKRMMFGDTQADVVARIESTNASLIVIDLVDERRGVWKFSDGTYLTNSVEAYRTGVDKWARAAGATLVEFGTDEHFALWTQGFTRVTNSLRALGKPMVLLDIAWASVFEGQAMPHRVTAPLRKAGRRSMKGIRSVVKAVQKERSVLAGIAKLSERPVQQGDDLFRTARTANKMYGRYVAEAERHVSMTITRGPDEVRMNRGHRWGIGPYHYSDHDYIQIGGLLSQIAFRE